MKHPGRRKTKTSKGWKSYQNLVQTKRKVLPAVIALMLIILLLGIAKSISIIRRINQPFNPSGTVLAEKTYSWDGQAPFNIVVAADSLYLLSFSGADNLSSNSSKSLTLIKIPDQTYLKLPFGYGRWEARSIYDLGQAENPPIGAKLLKETVSFTLGVPINGYLLLENGQKDNFLESVQNKRSNPIALSSLLEGSYSDLSMLEMIRLFMQVKDLRFDRVEVIDMEQSNLTKWEVLADGSRILSLNPLSLDQFIQQYFEDKELSMESLNIGVFNSTEYPQMAERAAKVITNLGGRVTFTANLEQKQAASLVLGKDSYTKNRLAQIFAPQCLKFDKSCQIEGSVENFSRADVNIILGEDYFLKFHKPQAI